MKFIYPAIFRQDTDGLYHGYFPDLDEMPEWKLVKESEEETYFDIEYQFLVYQK